VKLAEIAGSIGIGEAELGRYERAGVVGAERGLRRLARVAIETAWQIYGKAFCLGGVHLPNRGIQWRPRRASGAGA
jgi:hypothetical protein